MFKTTRAAASAAAQTPKATPKRSRQTPKPRPKPRAKPQPEPSTPSAVAPAKGSAPAPDPAKAEPAKAEPEHGYEFGGPIGAFGIIVGLPLVIYLLFFLCPSGSSFTNDTFCVSLTGDDALLEGGYDKMADLVRTLKPDQIYSHEAMRVVLAWIGLQAVLNVVLPGEVAHGVKLRDGSRLGYKLNGHLAFWVSLLLMAHGCPTGWPSEKGFTFEAFDLKWCYENYVQLATASVIVSFLLSFYLYVSSFASGKMLALGGNTGNWLYDFFIGRELNPRLGDGSLFDLKCFCELRPGLIGWVVLNLGCACAQAAGPGGISLSMIAVNIFQAFYVWDALYQERAILTTMDITTDGFGFMLAFGDLSWVPFTYSLQARYLVEHDPRLCWCTVAAICALNAVGYAIFRGANSEKDAFRRDPTAPECAHLKYMGTKRGTKLLISGFWGMARKINYTGDWLMGLSWCAVCGRGTMLPYFYAIYFAVLLVHRAIRDDGFCRGKYGADWDKYKEHVPAMFIPYVF